MFIELHIIQNFPPSCLNRDDTNTPKDCEFGGVRRARVSSQSFKRAIRWHPIFAKTTGQPVSPRTRELAEEVAKRLQKIQKRDETRVVEIANALVETYAGGMDDKGKTEVLLFNGDNEINAMAQAIHTNWDALNGVVPHSDPQVEKLAKKIAGQLKDKDKNERKQVVAVFLEKMGTTAQTLEPDKATLAKWVEEINQQWETLKQQKAAAAGASILPNIASTLKQASKNAVAIDIALFGRMLADKSPDKINVDAACQVAHAISTHRVTMEMDYFTAVDDLKPEDETGAGHINFTEFNSACFYRYACLDTKQLLKNVSNLDVPEELAKRAVEAFLRASFDAVPTGKKTWSAHDVRPSFVFAIVRNQGDSWSLANAFEKAVPLNDSRGLVEPSVKQLDDYWGVLSRVYGENGIVAKAALLLTTPIELPNLGGALKDNREEWFKEINQAVAAHLKEN